VLTGGELSLGVLPTLDRNELRRFSLAGSERYLLVEFPYTEWPLGLETALHDLGAGGLTAVLAHPERNKAVQAQPERLERVIGAGALVQVTASSLDGRGSAAARAAARRLLELGFVHVVASDAHSAAVREAGLTAAVDAIGDPALARHLVDEVPAAIVAGASIPALPRLRRRPGVASFFRLPMRDRP
jgi:protein-tyrosine phosphatase